MLGLSKLFEQLARAIERGVRLQLVRPATTGGSHLWIRQQTFELRGHVLACEL